MFGYMLNVFLINYIQACVHILINPVVGHIETAEH